MSVDSDVQAGAHAAAEPQAVAAPAANPALLGLITFLPSGITLGLWFLGYLDTANLPGGMIPMVSLSAGLFLMISSVWAARVAANTVSAIFGVFSAFWLSFGFLLAGLTSGWWGVADAAQVANVQRTYLLSFTVVFILLTLATLRLPLAFTAGFVFVDITFVLAFLGVSTGNAGLFPIAGITTLAFCVIFAYILVDGFAQDLGGKAMPMGNAIVK
ncbi:acetate uptake transporter family protein [Pseudonocardia pini]|uniref:acetate uptake transporter family protein n=1 Tax=Pseudonocardia pini TaxID=2758030 RepID=UPI0015F0998A|nr:GPR1/FUN34/YaaH family transporter [Pseudonocardia pini]